MVAYLRVALVCRLARHVSRDERPVVPVRGVVTEACHLEGRHLQVRVAQPAPSCEMQHSPAAKM